MIVIEMFFCLIKGFRS